MKFCNKCKVEKELTEFNKDKASKDGLQRYCRECKRNYYINNIDNSKKSQKEYRIKNAEKIKVYMKEYSIKNKDRIKELKSEYRIKNADKFKDYMKNYQINNSDKLKEYRKEYAINNKEKIKEVKREYKIKNYENIKLKNKEKQKEKRAKDYLFKFKENVSCLIRSSIIKQGYTKKSRTFQILGCTFEEFKVYIENKFTEGMSWENRSNWHLDHIYPVSLAKTEEEVIKLNHYTNFQPLWAIDNIRKSNKI